MNTVYPSAGVYTKETDLSQRIARVNSSIAAFVGAAGRGPVGERTLITDNVELEATFGLPNAQRYGYMLYCAKEFSKSSTRMYVTRVVNGALTAGAFITADDINASSPNLSINNFDNGSNVPLGRDDPFKNLGFNPGDPDITTNLMFVCAANPGAWNNRLALRIRPSNPKGRPVGSDHNVNHFYLDVYYDYTGPNNSPIESWLVSRTPGEVNANGDAMFVEDVINVRSKHIRVRNNPYCQVVPVLMSPFEYLAGGTDGVAVTNDQIADQWEIYDDPEHIDVNLLVNCGYTNPVVQRKMVSIAEHRFDAFAILDTPDANSAVSSAINYRRNDLNINSSYGGLYTPWMKVMDEANNKNVWIPPSGLVAAAFARNDTQRALWFAPAGVNRGRVNVNDVRQKYNQGARDALDQAQVNCVRKIPGRGYVIWGQATLQAQASALQNINVRRLFNYIKKAISTSVAFGVFDPNDVFLRRQLQNISESFLKPIKEGRGLYDYSVICDERNNKADTIANGDLLLDVYADPVIPVKQIHMTAFIQPTGTKFSEG